MDQLKGQDGTVANARKRAFIQQLQRARKYVLLTKTFPESILLAVPYVCVSRLDKLRMHELDLVDHVQLTEQHSTDQPIEVAASDEAEFMWCHTREPCAVK